MASDDSNNKPSTSSKKVQRKRKSTNAMSDETPKRPRVDRARNEKYKKLVKKSIKRLVSQDQASSSNSQPVVQEPPPERPPTRRGQVEFVIDRRSPDILVDKPLRPRNINERKR